MGAEEASAPGGALVFVGFMGAGKTSAARAAAAELGEAPLDADAALEAELGMPVAEFFERHGEAAFREREERVVGELLDRCDGGVVALGGGSVTSERVRAALGRHTVVWLDVEPDAAWQRASAGDGRPLARDRQRFDELHERRAPVYEQVADAILPPGERALVARALPALDALRGAPSGTRLVWAHSASEDYPVFIGPGLLASGFWPRAARRFCVTDDVVGPLYARALGAVETTVAIAAGEQHKTLPTAEHVLSALAAAGMTRADDVVALGGGVVGDLAGFCAATYQRGAGVVQVPTSLVAQVDSAYGGKTGVDLPAGKNYVGAYHQPALVLVDPALLGTLPEAELAAGYAEVLKTALIAGGPLWERVRAGAAGSEPELILACARTKLAVVARDERDQGARQALNLGHTVAHAIEAATGYRRYRHGEAVALGLLAALRLSGAERLREEVRELLAARGLPTALEADVDAVVQATARDKKRVGAGDVPFVLVSEPGSVQIGRAVEPGALRAAVAELAVR